MRRANGFEACILNAQNTKQKYCSPIPCVIILLHRSYRTYMGLYKRSGYFAVNLKDNLDF